MGLFAGFKAYVTSTFPTCVVENDNVGDGAGVVLDVMCALHAFKPQAGEEAPAQRLADSLWFSVYDGEFVAFCFDVADDTPAAKAICWQERPAPETEVSAADILRGLASDRLDNYDDIISNREARMVLCKWLQAELIKRFRLCANHPVTQLYFFGADGMPTHVTWDGCEYEYGPDLDILKRSDLHKPMHGEADISCVFAAHVMATECGAQRVEIRTVDTDVVMISCLNAFPGLQVQLAHFDRKAHEFVKVTYDINRMNAAVTATHKVTTAEWAVLCISRGTDYASRSMSGVPGWADYMELLCPIISARQCVVQDANEITINTKALHGTIVAGSAKAKRSKVLYAIDDGHLARVAWQLFYSLHAPLGKLEVPDCCELGWAQNETGFVERVKVAHGQIVMR
jgi:hypothetical protein